MDIMIFRLEDEVSRLNGDESALERFSFFSDLSSHQFNVLVDLVDGSDDYDWRQIMRTMKNTLTNEVAITVGRRKNGAVAFLFSDNSIGWFDADLMKFWVEV